MGNFINQASLYRYYYSNQEFSIINVGYDDFCVVKPSTEFRTQNFYTWHFVISGGGTLEIYDNQYDVKSGEMFFIPPNIPMRYFPKKSDPWEYVWFSFKGDLIEHYSELVGFSYNQPICECQNFEKIKKSLKNFLNMLIDDEGGYFSALSTFYKIMDILTACSESTGIHQIKRLLDENFATPKFCVEQVCHDVGISHAHLLRLFKGAYGVTLIKYIVKKRIELACEILISTNSSVSSVAYSCGFSDEIHFMKTFKKTMGISALQYRRNHLHAITDNAAKAINVYDNAPKK